MTIKYSESVDGPGWWFKTMESDKEGDAVRFSIFSSGDGALWKESGASGWQHRTDGSLVLRPGRRWPTTQRRGAEEQVKMSVPEHWQLISVGTYAVAAPMFLALLGGAPSSPPPIARAVGLKLDFCFCCAGDAAQHGGCA